MVNDMNGKCHTCGHKAGFERNSAPLKEWTCGCLCHKYERESKKIMKTRQKRKKKKGAVFNVPINGDDLICLWAAVVLREPEPLTRLLSKIIKPIVVKHLENLKKK